MPGIYNVTRVDNDIKLAVVSSEEEGRMILYCMGWIGTTPKWYMIHQTSYESLYIAMSVFLVSNFSIK